MEFVELNGWDEEERTALDINPVTAYELGLQAVGGDAYPVRYAGKFDKCVEVEEGGWVVLEVEDSDIVDHCRNNP